MNKETLFKKLKLKKEKPKVIEHINPQKITKTSHCSCKRKADLETLYKKYDIK